MNVTKRALLRALSAAVAAPTLLVAGCATPEAGDDAYRPSIGQPGKDVMWVPTLDALAVPMLEAAGVTERDLVYDLGSGDGKLPILAARRYGARAVGIEYDARLSALAQRNAERAGVTDRVRMIHGDIFREDFSAATVVALYVGQDLNLKLRPTLLAMRPGTRVVSNLFDMGTWEPDRVIRVPDQNPAYLWVVPARVEGEWEIAGLPEGGPATLRLAQTFQKVAGTLVLAGRPAAEVEGRLEGTRLVVELPAARGPARRIVGEVEGAAFRGGLEGDPARAVIGRRVR
ncbi:MAG TPA: methyltransferase domain-containing protein [Burkholderiaceae bacterium]|nr:methyltransferase domain-containing protein [Burkholderiaceae bacterium]